MTEALSGADRDAFARRARLRRYPRGRFLFHEGDPSDAVFLIRKGRVKISVFAPSGREIVLAIQGPDELLGELAVLDGRPRSATATALDDVEVLAVASSDFETFLDERPPVARSLLRALTGLLREASAYRTEHDGVDAPTRVARRLLALVERSGEHSGSRQVVPLHLTQDDLAAWVGISREAVNRALSRLRSKGVIDTGRGQITVVDVDALRDAARPTG